MSLSLTAALFAWTVKCTCHDIQGIHSAFVLIVRRSESCSNSPHGVAEFALVFSSLSASCSFLAIWVSWMAIALTNPKAIVCFRAEAPVEPSRSKLEAWAPKLWVRLKSRVLTVHLTSTHSMRMPCSLQFLLSAAGKANWWLGSSPVFGPTISATAVLKSCNICKGQSHIAANTAATENL